MQRKHQQFLGRTEGLLFVVFIDPEWHTRAAHCSTNTPERRTLWAAQPEVTAGRAVSPAASGRIETFCRSR